MNREEFEQIFRKPAGWVAGETQGRLVMGPWCIWLWRCVCKLLSYPAAWIVAALTALAMLGGCAALPYNPADMSAEQLTAAAKDKNASVVCAIGNTPYGRAVIVTVNLDQKVIAQGTVTVDDTCKTTITNAPVPKP